MEVGIEIFRHFGGPGTDFEDFVDFCTKIEPPGVKKESQNEVILYPKSDFLSVVFLMFFWSVPFSCFFEILGAQRLNLGKYFDSFLGGLGLCKML